jgi:hypothetical protein
VGNTALTDLGSMLPLPPLAAASKDATRTVAINLTAGSASTVMIALPAKIGRRNLKGPSTAIKSLTWGTPSSAAIRGIRSLPKLVEGPKTCEKSAATAASCGANTAARGCAFSGRSTRSTDLTPDNPAACDATAVVSAPKTTMLISPSAMPFAQVTHFAVAGFKRLAVVLADDEYFVH